ncbi:hypothetical protein PXK01_19620 [Phaeobacter sp. PT47_59]|nr:hypothetical protein [Phaeobacter sp. PT47_59]
MMFRPLMSMFNKSEKAEPSVVKDHRGKVLRQAALGQGVWVKDRDMHPQANIGGRLYRTKAGDVLFYAGLGMAHTPIDAWFFPSET